MKSDGAKQPALVVEGISKSFGGVHAVSNVSFHLDSGESMVLIGPNGAGKTTLFNLVTGVIPSDKGKITLFGEDISKRPVQRRSELGLVRTYQICNLFNGLTVEENLYLSLKNSKWQANSGLKEYFASWKTNKVRIDRVTEILKQVQLEDLRYVLVENISHGEQRQLELGMALITDPKIVLLDEPMAGLSATERVFIGEIVKRIANEKIVFVIEHDIEFALSVTNRVAVMNFGEILKMGTPEEIRNSSEVQQIYKLD